MRMLLPRLIATAGALVVLAGLTGCQKDEPVKTTMPVAWRNPDFSGQPFSKIFVIGVGRNDTYRRLYEDSMVRALESDAVEAQASWTLFPEPGKLDPPRVLVEVKHREFDAVVIARLRHVSETEEFVPARPATSSDLYMSGYDKAYAVNSAPAHYEKRTTYQVETSVYSTREDLLAWVVLSDTVDPESVEVVIHSVSEVVAKQMKAEGLLATTGYRGD